MKVLSCKVLAKVEIKNPSQELVQRGKEAAAFAGNRFVHNACCSTQPILNKYSLYHLQACTKCHCTCFVMCSDRGVIADKLEWQDEYCLKCKRLIRYTYYVNILWD